MHTDKTEMSDAERAQAAKEAIGVDSDGGNS